MTNQDRNIRTLITCFVIALVALVPLRIVESQNLVNQGAMVLGEETYNEEQIHLEENYVDQEVVYEEEIILEETEVIIEGVVEEEIELPNAELE